MIAQLHTWDTDSRTLEDNVPEYSIEQISLKVRRTVEDGFGRIRVCGEVSSISCPASGHVYLSFKEGRHQLDAVIWRDTARRIAQLPERGIEYRALGRLTAYSGHSKYQMVIERIEPAGIGALLAQLEERRERLRDEGLFDAEHKKPIPRIPQLIGVITSPGGAVIRDIVHRVSHRFPRPILVWPAAMQGANCVAEVCAAIRGFNALSSTERPDLLIVARGGGSLEDLLGFHDEEIVRAVFASDIPVISAIGHETDMTLIDHVADLRAPTPSAAAELAVPVRTELMAQLVSLDARCLRGARRSIEWRGQGLTGLSHRIPTPDALLAKPRQDVDLMAGRLGRGLTGHLQTCRLHLAQSAAHLLAPAMLRDAAAHLHLAGGRLNAAWQSTRQHLRSRLAVASGRDMAHNVTGLIERRHRDLSRADIVATTHRTLRMRADRLAATSRVLDSLSYRKTLERGFAVIRAKDRVVPTRAEAIDAEHLSIEFRDGHLPVKPDPQ